MNFSMCKAFHNGLQGMEIPLTDAMKTIQNTEANARGSIITISKPQNDLNQPQLLAITKSELESGYGDVH
jgi:hypothetical protein